MLKQYIKDLAAQQVRLKQERKTGTYTVGRTQYGWPVLTENVKAGNKAAAQVRCNAVKITAALNLYAKLRGKVPCHCWHDDYAYAKAYEELAKLYTQQ